MSAVDCPIHISKSPVITGEGNGFTTTFKLAVEEHPSELVTVTEYRVVAAGAEIIDEAVAPVDHKYVAPPEAVNTVVPVSYTHLCSTHKYFRHWPSKLCFLQNIAHCLQRSMGLAMG